MLELDGSFGEGGGQILRTALALALVTGTPFRIDQVRAGRARPGLLRQHLCAVQAAAAVGEANLCGADLGSRTLEFQPRGLRAGEHRFAIGSAGSAILVLQTILPALLLADAPSLIEIEGGTHNPGAPPFEFLDEAFAPIVRRMGAVLELELVRAGFHPAGGGLLRARVTPVRTLTPITLLERGPIRSRHAVARVARLPASIGKRELATLGAALDLGAHEQRIVTGDDSPGPGNALLLTIDCEHVTEVFCGFGERGKSSERVASEVAGKARRWLSGGAPVGEHLADQLMLTLALAGSGAFRTAALSEHARTNQEVITRFVPARWSTAPQPDGTIVVRLAGEGMRART